MFNRVSSAKDVRLIGFYLEDPHYFYVGSISLIVILWYVRVKEHYTKTYWHNLVILKFLWIFLHYFYYPNLSRYHQSRKWFSTDNWTSAPQRLYIPRRWKINKRSPEREKQPSANELWDLKAIRASQSGFQCAISLRTGQLFCPSTFRRCSESVLTHHRVALDTSK